MDFREIAEDKEILCTCQVQAARLCAFLCIGMRDTSGTGPFLRKRQTLSFTATGGTGETERKTDSERLGTRQMAGASVSAICGI